MSYVLKTYNDAGCFDLDTINVKVFQTMPDIFMPNAFVPSGRNKELRPEAVGITSLDYFRVYNRWGQLVFHTSAIGEGWDGRINGVLQNSGSYVWMVSGTDFTGKKIVKKGTATLIR
jgi:gliding motility-associated-like protein